MFIYYLTLVILLKQRQTGICECLMQEMGHMAQEEKVHCWHNLGGGKGTEFGRERYCAARKPPVFPATSRTVGKTRVKESLNYYLHFVSIQSDPAAAG